MVAATLAIRFPARFLARRVLPALRDYDQPPQCAMTYLMVASFAVVALASSSSSSGGGSGGGSGSDGSSGGGSSSRGSPGSRPPHPVLVEHGEELSISIATWLGAPDGLARTIAQYAMFAVTDALQLVPPLQTSDDAAVTAATATLGEQEQQQQQRRQRRPVNPYVAEQMRFLDQNHKCAKMREKQTRIFRGLDPVQSCSLRSLLASATGYDLEFATGSLLEEVKAVMEGLFASFTESDGAMGSAHGRALLEKAQRVQELRDVETLLDDRAAAATAATASASMEGAGAGAGDGAGGGARGGSGEGDGGGVSLAAAETRYMQRKVLPWKLHELIGTAELEKELRVAGSVRPRVQDFIMCASLVDKVRALAVAAWIRYSLSHTHTHTRTRTHAHTHTATHTAHQQPLK